MIDILELTCENVEVNTIEPKKIKIRMENIQEEGILSSIQEYPNIKHIVDLIGSDELLHEIYPHEILRYFRNTRELSDLFEGVTQEEYLEFLPDVLKTFGLEDVLNALPDSKQKIIKTVKKRKKDKRNSLWFRFFNLFKRR